MWTRLHSGSVYHPLYSMAQKYLVVADGKEPSDSGPGKTPRSLAAVAEAEFLDLLRQGHI